MSIFIRRLSVLYFLAILLCPSNSYACEFVNEGDALCKKIFTNATHVFVNCSRVLAKEPDNQPVTASPPVAASSLTRDAIIITTTAVSTTFVGVFVYKVTPWVWKRCRRSLFSKPFHEITRFSDALAYDDMDGDSLAYIDGLYRAINYNNIHNTVSTYSQRSKICCCKFNYYFTGRIFYPAWPDTFLQQVRFLNDPWYTDKYYIDTGRFPGFDNEGPSIDEVYRDFSQQEECNALQSYHLLDSTNLLDKPAYSDFTNSLRSLIRLLDSDDDSYQAFLDKSNKEYGFFVGDTRRRYHPIFALTLRFSDSLEITTLISSSGSYSSNGS